MSEDDYKDEEIIDVKLTREQYKLLKNVLIREQSENWITSAVKNNWIWIVSGGVLTVWMLYDRIQLFLHGGVK